MGEAVVLPATRAAVPAFRDCGLQPAYHTCHLVLTSGELLDRLPQHCETLRQLLYLLRVDGGGGGRDLRNG